MLREGIKSYEKNLLAAPPLNAHNAAAHDHNNRKTKKLFHARHMRSIIITR